VVGYPTTPPAIARQGYYVTYGPAAANSPKIKQVGGYLNGTMLAY
jgi:hypothetical protein